MRCYPSTDGERVDHGRNLAVDPIAVALELFIGAMIRGNLTLNVVMFLWPLDSVLEWQKGR